ncbi:MAG: hypothetical protein NT062_03785 [Proteobacteria bacterium]|nr:hypothetical protein [Pseudomonadota bacterium]
MKAVRPTNLTARLAAFLALAGREAIAVVEGKDRDEGRPTPDKVDFVAMPFAQLPADFPSESMRLPYLRTYIADGLVGSGKPGVARRVDPPRLPAVALLRADDYRVLAGADFADLRFVALG